MEQKDFLQKKVELIEEEFFFFFSIDYITFCISSKEMCDYLIDEIKNKFPNFQIYIQTIKNQKKKLRKKESLYAVCVYPFETDYGTFWRFSILGKNANLFFHSIFFELPFTFFSMGTITIKRIDVKYSFKSLDVKNQRNIEFVKKIHENFLSTQTSFKKNKKTAFNCVFIQSENSATSSLGCRNNGYYVRICSNLEFDYIEFELKKHCVLALTKYFCQQNRLLFFSYLLEKLFSCSTRIVNHELTECFFQTLAFFEENRRLYRSFVFSNQKELNKQIKYRHFKKKEMEKKVDYRGFYYNNVIFFSDFIFNLPDYPEFFDCFFIIFYLYCRFFRIKLLRLPFEDFIETVHALNPKRNASDTILIKEGFFTLEVYLPSLLRSIYGSSITSIKQKFKRQLAYIAKIPYNPELSNQNLHSFYKKPLITDIVFKENSGAGETFSFSFNFLIFDKFKPTEYVFCDLNLSSFSLFFQKTNKNLELTKSAVFIFITFSFLLQNQPIYIDFIFLFYNINRYEKKQQIFFEFFLFLNFCLKFNFINGYSFNDNFFINREVSFEYFKKEIKKSSNKNKIFISSNFKERLLEEYIKKDYYKSI